MPIPGSTNPSLLLWVGVYSLSLGSGETHVSIVWLFVGGCHPKLSSLHHKWSVHVLGLGVEDWMEIWDFPLSLVSARDRLVQFKILHRAYYTPYRLHKMASSHSPTCWRCPLQTSDFIHILWTCPAIIQYRHDVLEIISHTTQITVPCEPQYCLLGLVE